jgi:hypothetical protein
MLFWIVAGVLLGLEIDFLNIHAITSRYRKMLTPLYQVSSSLACFFA